jgi:hypothetical protein
MFALLESEINWRAALNERPHVLSQFLARSTGS